MTFRDFLSAGSTTVLVAAALLVTGLVVRREFLQPVGQVYSPAGALVEPRRIPNWEELIGRGQTLGSPDAPVKVLVFSDYQCPACRVIDADLKAVLSANQGNFAVIVRHFPLANHPVAVNAAVAAECAGQAGRFGAYHGRLFAEQQWIGVTSWRAFAADVGGVNLDQFDQCTSDAATAAVVKRDYDLGRRLELKGTPTVFVDGYELVGRLLRQLPDYLDRAFANAQIEFIAPAIE